MMGMDLIIPQPESAADWLAGSNLFLQSHPQLLRDNKPISDLIELLLC